MDREAFATQLQRVAPTIEAALEQWALPEGRAVPNLDDGVRYALGLGLEPPEQRGKRLRPALAILTCEALGGQVSRVMPFAVAVELLHNYFLVHDDIEDGDTTRHGRPTVWQRFGLAHGVNIGDYLQGRVTAVALESRECGLAPETVVRLVELLSETQDHTCRGQALDLNARTAATLTVEQYLALVTEKTGRYLAAPLIGGAIVAEADEALLGHIRAYGAAIGPMYQIVDDLLDLTEAKGRGERGADVREGKRSFMVACALETLEEARRAELLAILDQSREGTSPAAVARALELLEQCGAVERAHAQVAELAETARAAAAPLPEKLSGLLAGAADFLAHRSR